MKLCDLSTAKALQELGYDGEYAKSYTDFDNPTFDITTSLLYPTEIPAPRLDDAAYWIRDKYGIGIYPYSVSQTSIACYMNGDFKLATDRTLVRDFPDLFKKVFNTYEEALENGVAKALEIIKSQKQ